MDVAPSGTCRLGPVNLPDAIGVFGQADVSIDIRRDECLPNYWSGQELLALPCLMDNVALDRRCAYRLQRLWLLSRCRSCEAIDQRWISTTLCHESSGQDYCRASRESLGSSLVNFHSR